MFPQLLRLFSEPVLNPREIVSLQEAPDINPRYTSQQGTFVTLLFPLLTAAGSHGIKPRKCSFLQISENTNKMKLFFSSMRWFTKLVKKPILTYFSGCLVLLLPTSAWTLMHHLLTLYGAHGNANPKWICPQLSNGNLSPTWYSDTWLKPISSGTK